MNARTTAISALSLAALAGFAQAQSCPTMDKFDNGASGSSDDNYAAAIAVSYGGLNNCTLVAVGQPGEDAPVSGTDAGGFTVYQKPFGSWTVMYDQWNTTGVAGERLGASISLADPYLIAGAPGYSNTGRARIYRRPSNGSGYTGPVDVYPSLSGAGSDFGKAVAVSAFGGGWAAVGAPMHDFHGEVDAGAVFFYTRDDATNTWNQTAQIWGADFTGRTGDHRGTAVAMAQQTEFCAVGSPDREMTGQPTDHGSVRVVYRLANGFVSGQSTEVAPPSPEAGEHFGAAVAIENDILVVGAPDEDMTLQEGGFLQAATDGGAIYIYQKHAGSINTWDFVSKLRSPTPVNGGHFGSQVSTDGGLQIVVGEAGTKKVYIITNDGGAWHHQAAVSDPDTAASGSFGSGVAVRNGEIAIADTLDDNNTYTNAGAVYMMNLESDIPTGDSCSNPLAIPAGDYIGCTSLATPTQSAAAITTCGNGGSGQGNDVYFIFQPSCDGNAIFDTFGSTFDTVLSVHSSCPNVLGVGTTITCNDDASFAAPHNRDSLVTFNFTGGETYYIRVTGYNLAQGQFTLRHLYTYATINDECSSASVLGSSFGSWPVNTCVATTSNLASACGAVTPQHDVWYRWNATSTGPVNVNTCGSSFDTVLNVYQGTQQNCPVTPGSAIACNDDSFDTCNIGGWSYQSDLTFTATAGQSYLIRLGGYHTTDFGPAILTVGQGTYCGDIDFNNDGLFPDTQDIDDLLAVFSGGPCPTGNCDPIDFNNDGLFPDTFDIDSFLSVFSGGACLR